MLWYYILYQHCFRTTIYRPHISPRLSSDLRRVIGHAICMESTELSHVHELMQREPIILQLTGGDISKIPLFRWRHIRDYTLRIDDGRFGFPCLCLAMDHDTTDNNNNNNDDDNDANPRRSLSFRQQLKEEFLQDVEAETTTTTSTRSSKSSSTNGRPLSLDEEQLEYLIRSERVIAAGPLHLPTPLKDDPKSWTVGDLILFNAKNRQDAVDFVENMPNAQEGLYQDVRVHFYNTLDITGKFVSEDPLSESPCADMKEAMEYWGYPVDDQQTPWLNG